MEGTTVVETTMKRQKSILTQETVISWILKVKNGNYQMKAGDQNALDAAGGLTEGGPESELSETARRSNGDCCAKKLEEAGNSSRRNSVTKYQKEGSEY